MHPLLITLAMAVVGVMLGSLVWAIVERSLAPFHRPQPRSGPVKVGVVLGSGGHTSEMMRALHALPRPYWKNSQPFYVVSATDQHSARLAQDFEQDLFKRRPVLHVIPRAREVGQDYFTSIWTTLLALRSSFAVVYCEEPDVLFTNGPGVCVPVVLASFLLSVCCIWYGRRRPVIVYMESFTCVKQLSLTGKLFAPLLADIFTVYWKDAEDAVARIRWRGKLYRIGNGTERSGSAEKVSLLQARTREGTLDSSGTLPDKYALVTVGSTRFDDLIYAMCSMATCKALRVRFGVSWLLLQYGTMDFAPRPSQSQGQFDGCAATLEGSCRGTCAGVIWEAFAYCPALEQCMRGAALVITHAGVGTILECLYARCPIVVVPNRRLMSDHQLDLANALARGGYLYSVSVNRLCEQLQTLDFSKLSAYPGIDQDLLSKVLTSFSAQEKDEEKY